jgi:acetyl esterase/lipase
MANKFVYQSVSRHSRRRRSWTWILAAVLIAVGLSYSYGRYLPPELGGLPPVFKKASAVGGKLIEQQHVTTIAPHQVDNEARVVYPNQPDLPNARSNVEQYLITYTSEDPRSGREVRIRARLYLPAVGANVPALIFGPGTTGPGPACAPSLERSRNANWGRYDNHMAYYAGQGRAVAITDFNGRGEGEIHHYFVGEMEGRAMLDLARALRRVEDVRLPRNLVGDNVFMAGYSQGGHAALWADRIQADYAPEVKIRGIIGFAPATDPIKMFNDTGSGTASTWIPPYIYAAYRDYYGLATPANTFFKDPIAANVSSDARKFCIDQVETKTGHFGTPATIGNIYQPEFLESLRNRTFKSKYPEWAGLLEQNLAGEHFTATPKLFIAGQKDFVITPSAQVELMQRVCKSSQSVAQLDLHPEVTHYTAMAVGRSRMDGWISQNLNGQRLPSNCAAYRV